MSDREVMQLALEALDSDNPDIQLRAAIALRTALAAPQPEPVDVGLLEYRGNSVAYIYQKMWSYKENNMAAWAALGDKGIIADGKTTLAEMIAKRTTLAAPPPQPDALALAERLASGRLAIIEQLTGELEALRRDAVHPGYVIGSHWLETAYSRICAGEAEADVLRDYGLVRVTDAEALRREAERLKAERDEAVRAEREACAKVCEQLVGPYAEGVGSIRHTTHVCATAIRARGQEPPR